MARKTKVEMSPHFKEIHSKLARGISPDVVSAWLENEYNESITPRSLYRYKKKFLPMDVLVEKELNKRYAQEEIQEAQGETQKEVKKAADNIEIAALTTKTVTTVNADNMQGVMNVAADFPNRYEKACAEAIDPTSPTTQKDCAKLALDANKLVNDFFNKKEDNIEVNVNNLSNLVDENEVLRFINESESTEQDSE